ncbi:alpha/beta hydrolase [Sphingomonas profundi]|uniref:alpha/beta hydrolase n=1 Tax=Alterirhizorhabdus profundi TaxID=2681549 RepID=UPI0012E8104B|nr:alpha/beta hydrolase [Sphingomonas profundi]
MTGRTPTAGLRGAFWDPARLPDGVRLTAHPLPTQDKQIVSGFLLARGGETTVAVIAHPREHLVPHYLAAELAAAGVAVFLQAPRLTGNDIRLEHEMALYDLAAALTFLRARGFQRIVAVGNSGGGPLWAFYNQQALLPGERRIARTPGGRPTRLESADLPVPDGLIFVSTHLGQGALLMNGIDPSVTDEGDAFSVDPALDPFAAANGYAPSGGARYAPDFVARYRAAQRARIARIDAFALDHVRRRAEARRRIKDGTGTPHDRASAAHTPIFPVWRTDADLRCWDLGIDPSDRHPGSLWGSDPFASNYGSIGFGRTCTPESWLSTWSGLCSNASMARCAPAIEQPTLLIEYTGDASTFPSEVDALFDMIGAADKSRVAFAGDHHGRPLAEGAPNPKRQVGEAMGDWLAARFPVAVPQG